jgi:tRNA A-37 threonylcarbamoyl transferase component Bud32
MGEYLSFGTVLVPLWDALRRHGVGGDFFEEIGAGVFSVSVRGNRGYALKIIFLPTVRGNTFDREVEIIQKMSRLGVTVPYISSWKAQGFDNKLNVTVDIGFILMEKWEALPVREIPASVMLKVLDLIRQMHDAFYVHGDPRIENIVVRRNKNGEVIDTRLIDFGDSFDYRNQVPTDIRNRVEVLNRDRGTVITARDSDELVSAVYSFDYVGWLR